MSYIGAVTPRGKGVNIRAQEDGLLYVAESGAFPRFADTVTITCNADADGITSESAPVAAEVYTLTPPAGCVGMDAVWEEDSEGVPYARGALIVVGAADITEALDQLTIPDNTPGSTYATGNSKMTFIGRTNPVRRYSWAADDVSRVDVGFLLATGTGATANRIHFTFRY